MRIRKKPNLSARLERCADIIISNPETLRGRWLETIGASRLWLELGCGKGAFTADLAEENPEALIIAVEKVPDAMVIAAERAHERGLKNIRFIDADARCLSELFSPGEVSRIYLNFCDPWPRSHDAKHRLTAPGFQRLYATALSPEGEVIFKTDNAPLFDWSLEQFRDEGWELKALTRNLHEKGEADIMTDYERKFHALGIPINRLVAVKTPTTKDTAAGEPPRMYNAGIERPYRTSEILKGTQK